MHIERVHILLTSQRNMQFSGRFKNYKYKRYITLLYQDVKGNEIRIKMAEM